MQEYDDVRTGLKVFKMKKCSAVTFDNVCSERRSAPCGEDRLDVGPIVNRFCFLISGGEFLQIKSSFIALQDMLLPELQNHPAGKRTFRLQFIKLNLLLSLSLQSRVFSQEKVSPLAPKLVLSHHHHQMKWRNWFIGIGSFLSD